MTKRQDKPLPKAGDKESVPHDPIVGEYYTGAGNIDRTATEPGARQPSEDEEKERIKEDRANKDFDTPHVHSSTTSRKV